MANVIAPESDITRRINNLNANKQAFLRRGTKAAKANARTLAAAEKKLRQQRAALARQVSIKKQMKSAQGVLTRAMRAKVKSAKAKRVSKGRSKAKAKSKGGGGRQDG